MVETVESPKSLCVPCKIRLMRKEDVPQVTDIDREAFPTMWPPINFAHELENRMAHYTVACKEAEPAPPQALPEKPHSGFKASFKKLFSIKAAETPRVSPDHILGFIGIWMMADEAHIINIAVSEKSKRQGIGECLLISAIDLAFKLRASLMTLEVRASNLNATKLYRKYGFIEVGIRKGYYTDNKEDAVLMTIESLNSPGFREKFQSLKEAHLKRLGISTLGSAS